MGKVFFYICAAMVLPALAFSVAVLVGKMLLHLYGANRVIISNPVLDSSGFIFPETNVWAPILVIIGSLVYIYGSYTMLVGWNDTEIHSNVTAMKGRALIENLQSETWNAIGVTFDSSPTFGLVLRRSRRDECTLSVLVTESASEDEFEAIADIAARENLTKIMQQHVRPEGIELRFTVRGGPDTALRTFLEFLNEFIGEQAASLTILR